MSTESYGAKSRRPVYSGNRRVRGLYERTCANGTTVYDVMLRLGGKVRRFRLEACTKTDAIAELRALEVDHDRGEPSRSPALSVTVAELARDYIAHLEARVGARDPRRRRSPRTVALYRQRLEQHIVRELGPRPAGELTVADVRRLLDRLAAKRLAPSTVTSIMNILSGMLRFGVKARVVERNVVRDLDRDDRPGTGRLSEPRYLAPDEVDRLLANVSDAFRPVALACALAGLRISEAFGLRWRDVDFKAETLTVEFQLGPEGELAPVKSPASAAPVPLLPALARELRAHRSRLAARDLRQVRPDALVFTTARGKPQSRRNALRAVHAAGDNAGLNGAGREPVGLHDLRHSFVANALAAGVTLPEAATLARHANARTTAIVYAGVTEQAREGIAAKLLAAGLGG